MDRGVDRAVNVDGHDAVKPPLVEKTDRVGIADRPVAELDRDRIAVVQHVDVEQRPGHQGVEHDGADRGDHRAVNDGARPDGAKYRRLSDLAAMNVDVVVITDQPGFPADLLHHGVAGGDAKPALNAVELGAVADVDAGRTYRYALVTIDAVAGVLADGAQFGGLLQ